MMPNTPWHYGKATPRVMYETTRDVAIDAKFNWIGRNVAKGEKFYKFTGNAYNAVDTENEMTLSEYGPAQYPFFGFPRDALKMIETEVTDES